MSIITLQYQDHAIAYQDDGWFNATQAAAKFGKEPVIYCFGFRHGVCKVGKTKNLQARASSFNCHGVLTRMFVSLNAVPCPVGALADAERIALALFAERFKRLGPEVFALQVGAEEIQSLLQRSVLAAVSAAVREPVKAVDFSETAGASGLWTAFEWLACARHEDRTIGEAVDFVLTASGMSDESVKFAYECLHGLSAELVPNLLERNAVLIGRGLSYDQRKPTLKQYAMDWRMTRITNTIETA